MSDPTRTLHFDALDPEVASLGQGKNYLFVIGIDHYHHCPRLNNAVKDAREVIRVLTERYEFDTTHTVTLFDEAATEANILKAFKDFAQEITPQDNLMLYFSGHGHFDPILKEGFWIPVNARHEHTGDYISNATIVTYLRAINSLHTFLVSDACFSGTLLSPTRSFAERVMNLPSRWGLTSGRQEVVQDGPMGEHSPFAAALIDFLRHNTQDRLRISKIIQYVEETTANNSEQTPIGNRIRNVGDKGGEMILYLKESEEKAWDLVQHEQTIVAALYYLKRFPQGAYADEAHALIEIIEDKEAWEAAQNKNNISGYLNYKKLHPEGQYFIAATEAIEVLQGKRTARKSVATQVPNAAYGSPDTNPSLPGNPTGASRSSAIPVWVYPVAGIVLLGIILVIWSPWSSPSPSTDGVAEEVIDHQKLAQNFLRQAQQEIRSGDFKQAQVWLDSAANHPYKGSAEDLKKVVSLLQTQQDALAEANKETEAATAREEGYRKAMERGKRLASAGEYPEAITQFELALKNKPGDAEAQQYLRAAQERWRKAQQQQQAEEDREKAFATHMKRGLAYYKERNYSAALQEYRAALKYKPKDATVLRYIQKCEELLTPKVQSLSRSRREIRSEDYLITYGGVGTGMFVLTIEAINDFENNINGKWPNIDFATVFVDRNRNGKVDKNVDVKFGVGGGIICAQYMYTAATSAACNSFRTNANVKFGFMATRNQSKAHPSWTFYLPAKDLTTNNGKSAQIAIRIHTKEKGYVVINGNSFVENGNFTGFKLTEKVPL